MNTWLFVRITFITMVLCHECKYIVKVNYYLAVVMLPGCVVSVLGFHCHVLKQPLEGKWLNGKFKKWMDVEPNSVKCLIEIQHVSASRFFPLKGNVIEQDVYPEHYD